VLCASDQHRAARSPQPQRRAQWRGSLTALCALYYISVVVFFYTHMPYTYTLSAVCISRLARVARGAATRTRHATATLPLFSCPALGWVWLWLWPCGLPQRLEG
jgi:hypothetical protein